MPEQYEPEATDTAPPGSGHPRGIVDLLAFLGALIFAVGLALLIDRTGQLSARLAFAGAAGLVVGCVTAWRRLRRPELRHWRNGQAIYRGHRVTLMAGWGVEGQPLPAIEPSAATAKDGDRLPGPTALPVAASPNDGHEPPARTAGDAPGPVAGQGPPGRLT